MGIGFEQGLSSPWSVYHNKLHISVVVHGGDFTALGTDASLDAYEAGLAKYFELKIKGRLGLDAKDDKEMRVLNRIVRVDPSGLSYEADPRHAELLVQSMNLQGCSPVATPGIKKPFEDAIMDVEINDDVTITNLSPVLASATIRVSFNEVATSNSVKAYSDHYPIHPKQFVFGKAGQYIMIKQGEDSSNGMPKDEIDRRNSEEIQRLHANGTPAKRRNILRKVLIDGNPWEESNGTLIAKVSKKFVKNRL